MEGTLQEPGSVANTRADSEQTGPEAGGGRHRQSLSEVQLVVEDQRLALRGLGGPHRGEWPHAPISEDVRTLR